MDQTSCSLPPKGWYCTLPKGHDGPCPAWPKRRLVAIALFRVAHWVDDLGRREIERTSRHLAFHRERFRG